MLDKVAHVILSVTFDDAGFRTPLSEDNRQDIADKSGEVQVGQLMLSPLGAWMNLRAQWVEPAGTGSWQHRATMGRDHYVRVATPGYLYPFGHRALKVEITERKFSAFNPGAKSPKVGAWLVKRAFIVVLEQEKDYAATAQTAAGRQMPFKRVRIATAVTPDLAPGGSGPFIIKEAGGNTFLFPLTATDADARVSDFKSALVFIDSDQAAKAEALKTASGAYNKFAAVEMPGSKVTYAPAQADKSGVTAFETSRVKFDVDGAAEKLLNFAYNLQRTKDDARAAHLRRLCRQERAREAVERAPQEG